jgi:hypothetical protein
VDRTASGFDDEGGRVECFDEVGIGRRKGIEVVGDIGVLLKVKVDLEPLLVRKA